MIRRALFSIVFKVVLRVVVKFGAQTRLAYSKTERMDCLYMSVRVSLCCPKSVLVGVQSVFASVCAFLFDVVYVILEA